ncbi:hypothetical protein OIU92_00025 [Escherichia coli]|nr:hypothetical protein [Escherichia coli]
MNTFSESDVLPPHQKRWVADDSKPKIAEKSPPYRFNLGRGRADAALTASLKKRKRRSDHFISVRIRRWPANLSTRRGNVGASV